VRGYVSTVFGCPYEGDIPLKKIEKVVKTLLDFGIDEVSLGDTIGLATPNKVIDLMDLLKKHYEVKKIAMHFHDTRGMALANILASLECGVTTFDSSAGGLGGCPYAKGATGNVATEELVYLFDSLGIKSGVDLEKLLKASEFIFEHLKGDIHSKFFKAYQKTKS